MVTEVLTKQKGSAKYYISTTDPNDPDAVPAFETSAGIPESKYAGAKKPVVVNKYALENFNATVSPDAVKRQLEAANVAALFAKRAIRPDEIAALRRRMFEVVAKGLEDVDQVLEGKKTWSSTQVRLFHILTERVMPKLSSVTISETSSKQIEDLSIDELEKIALGKRTVEAVDAIVKEGAALEAEAEAKESKEAERLLKQKLIKVGSIEEAEKVYTKLKEDELAGKRTYVKKKQVGRQSLSGNDKTSPKASDVAGEAS